MRALILLAAAALALGGCSRGEPDRKGDTRTIEHGEKAWGGMLISGDAAAADRLLDDSFRGVAPDGHPYDKAEMLRIIRDGPHATADQVEGVKVAFYGDTAVAQGIEHEVGPAPAKRAIDHVFTDTWVKTAGQWRIVAAEDVERAAR